MSPTFTCHVAGHERRAATEEAAKIADRHALKGGYDLVEVVAGDIADEIRSAP